MSTVTKPNPKSDPDQAQSVNQKARPSLMQMLSWQWLIRRIVLLSDSAHSIALGAAIGVFIALTPTVGIQMLLVLVVGFICSPIFRFNQIAGMLAVYISNPITTLPIYWFNYQVGTWFVEGNLTREELSQILHFESISQWMSTLSNLLFQVGEPLLIGSFLVGIICALPTYPVIYWLVEETRKRKNAHQTNEKSGSLE